MLATFDSHRRQLLGLAYRMLGSVAEAEDVVQDAWLRWHATDRATVRDPRSFLYTCVTRLCLDRLKSAAATRERYEGPWLPEPLVDAASYGEDLGVALMLALERLSPLERAAFLLHDVFDVEYASIAETLGRDEAAVRQLAARGRAHARETKRRFAVSEQEGQRIAEAFQSAIRTGDVAHLQALLAAEVVLHTDGGGLKRAARNLILGQDRVVRFFAGLHRNAKGRQPGVGRFVVLNGLPGWVGRDVDGELQATTLELEGDAITAIYVVRNPLKLTGVRGLIEER